MSLDFSKDYLHINGSGNTTPQFFKKGFWINRPSSPSPGWQDVTVSGNDYVNLVNAKANGLNYLKLYGTCEQTGTPTPLAPIDIKCNNGVLKANAQGQIYTDGTVETVKDSLNNTATAEILYGLSDNNRDYQEIKTGVITRQTGILVFDGTESWALSNGAFNLSDVATNVLYGSTYPCICTHYIGGVPNQTVAAMPDLSCKVGANSASIRNRLYIKDSRFADTTAFKEFLKDEFNKGTPVIMIYPKNENETESTTPQTLTTKKGENTIEITQASINPLKLEAQYKAGAEVTIEEVEDANLDNNVTVTIGE